MKILVTGAAGFIGSHVAKILLDRGDEVVGLDNLNSYYEVSLKEARLRHLLGDYKRFKFVKLNLQDRKGMEELFRKEQPQRVINLAAQAGVRYSLTHPHVYIDSNIQGMINILEGCRHNNVEHLVFASSSSVYGANGAMPFSIHDNVDHPVSLYAVSKKSNELMAHCYSHLYQMPTTGLRFFSVYGAWGRPDMALFLFTEAMLNGKAIDVFNHGRHRRDFTYIDDIAEGVVRVVDKVAEPNSKWDKMNPDPGTSMAPYRLYNIGNNQPVELLDFISILEDELGVKATRNLLPMAKGDVPDTCADIDDLEKDFGYRPTIPVREGVKRFVNWYLEYYKVSSPRRKKGSQSDLPSSGTQSGTQNHEILADH